jgi:hypothetical protein
MEKEGAHLCDSNIRDFLEAYEADKSSPAKAAEMRMFRATVELQWTERFGGFRTYSDFANAHVEMTLSDGKCSSITLEAARGERLANRRRDEAVLDYDCQPRCDINVFQKDPFPKSRPQPTVHELCKNPTL